MPPAGKGIWGAAWLQPVDQTKYGKWPASGEIDLAGAVNDKQLLAQAIHYGSPCECPLFSHPQILPRDLLWP